MRIGKALLPFLLVLAAGCSAASPSPAPTAAGTKKPAAAATRLKPSTKTPSAIPSSTPQVVLVIDDFEEDGTEWMVCVDPECADSSAVDVALTSKHAAHGDYALQLNFEKNEKLKAIFYIERPMDLSGGGAVRFEIYHEGTINGVGFALTTGEGEVWHESDAIPVASGRRISLLFDLAAENYKTEATNWDFRAPITDLDRVVRLSIILYPRISGFAVIDNVILTDGS